MLVQAGIYEVVITTGPFESELVDYCQELELPVHVTYVKNPEYMDTNYIYSIYCARKWLDDDLVLMHGDLVFENEAFDRVLESSCSCMAVSSSLDLPQKDFKAVIKDGMITEVISD